MMKKRWAKMGILFITLLVLGIGCSKKEDGTTVDKEEKTTAAKEEETTSKTESKTDTEKKDEKDEAMKTESGSATAPEPEQKGPVKFQVYFSNDDATDLIKETVEVDEISPENVRKALVEKGALPEEVKINSLVESEKDGEKVLDVDVSREFVTHVSNMGSTGEYMALGSLCNTFLDAYGCKKIHITVEGDIFTTGHNEYPGYLGFHE